MTAVTHELDEEQTETGPSWATVVCSCSKRFTVRYRRDPEDKARGLHRIHVAVERARANQPESEAG